MPNITLDKDKFLEILGQFTNDIVFETTMITQLLGQLPPYYRETLSRELFIKNSYKKDYYKVYHHIYTLDSYLFLTFQEVQKFINENKLRSQNYTQLEVGAAINAGDILEGFRIEIIKKGES